MPSTLSNAEPDQIRSNNAKRKAFLAIYEFLLHRRQMIMTLCRPVTLAFALYHRGTAVQCSCCGGKFKKFLPFGADKRPNALCPGCFALERHRMIWRYFQERTDLYTADHKMLHVAPEFIFQRRFKAMKNLNYLSSDLYPTEAMVKMDITDIEMPDDVFDVIYCSHVFEHIPDDRKAMRELYRVLKPGGWAVLQVPLDPSMPATREGTSEMTPMDRERLLGHHDHQRLYGLDYKDRLEAAGFTVRVDDYALEFSDDERKRLGFRTDEAVYYCTKRAPN